MWTNIMSMKQRDIDTKVAYVKKQRGIILSERENDLIQSNLKKF